MFQIFLTSIKWFSLVSPVWIPRFEDADADAPLVEDGAMAALMCLAKMELLKTKSDSDQVGNDSCDSFTEDRLEICLGSVFDIADAVRCV